MKRLVHYFIEDDGRKKVQSISAPLDETKIELLDNTGFIDSNYSDPMPIDGKKIELYYNSDTQLIEVEYADILFEDLSPLEQVAYLRKENESLKDELSLTQDCIMALDEIILGLTEEDSEEEPDEGEDCTEEPEEPIETPNPVDPLPEETETSEVFDLVKAVEDARDGDTLVLTSDVNLESELYMNKTLTIDLNGHKIESKQDVFGSRSSKCNVTFVGEGEIRGGTGGNYVAIEASAGQFTIDGNIKCSVGHDANNEGNSCIYVSGTGKIYINNGEFSSDVPYNGKYFVLNKKNGSNGIIEVTGGTYVNYDPSNGDDAEGGTFVAEGYVANMEIGDDGIKYIVVKDESLKNDVEEVESSKDVESKDEIVEGNNEQPEVTESGSDTISTENETNVGGNE